MDKFNEVQLIINEWDPIGLMDLGCPPDEYTPEIKDILGQLPEATSVDDLAIRVREVFIKWFKQAIPLEECHPIAAEIWRLTKYH